MTVDTPAWVRDAVFYQIFPDRFADGNPANNGADTIRWGGPPSSSKRMGGDLKGISTHLPYLRDLGVNALYLTPVFTARSSHGYDTTDYHQIDPHFGAAADLEFEEAARFVGSLLGQKLVVPGNHDIPVP